MIMVLAIFVIFAAPATTEAEPDSNSSDYFGFVSNTIYAKV